MSKKANPTVIGGFVVGALALAIAGIAIFGGGKFFAEETEYVMYFGRSVKGLDVGAPVVFRGVPVGSVKSIEAHWEPEEKNVRIPVHVSLMKGQIKGAEEESRGSTPEQLLTRLIDEWGLRAQLVLDSLVTGKLFVGLDFLPGAPKNLHGHETLPEIPTVPTDLEQLTRKIENLQIDKLVDNANRTIENVNGLLESEQIKQILDSLDGGLKDLREVIRKLDGEVEPLSKSARDALDQGKAALAHADKLIEGDLAKLIRDVDAEVEPLSRSAQSMFGEGKDALENANELLSDRSGLRLQIAAVLEELAGAARSIRVLVQYLERHPEALFRGKELR